ncbi:MAG: rhomboid family intramembrane serine protease [Planctomycetes bacterium]|nr:rhomboid family intramembrane serine protease [Planctomycetota bacterium]MCB9905231.1 rhomboid family intramembrane serine protease [Planctomycetota bacterium]
MTKRLLIACFAVQAVFFLLSLVGESAAVTVRDWFSVNPSVWANYKAPALWQFVTYGFLHDPNNIFHLLWNMLQLYFFGTMLESLVGSRRFAVTYFGALALGGLLHLVAQFIAGPRAVDPVSGVGYYSPVIGASGAIMGVIVACAVLRPHARILLIFIPISLWVLAAGLVAIDFFSELLRWKNGTHSYIAHWAHLGGALYGGLVAWRGWIWIDWGQRFERRREERRVESERNDDRRLDELLAKVHREGIQSLTKSERDFLNRMSGRRR